MAAEHPFISKAKPDPYRAGYFTWVVSKYAQPFEFAPRSYATCVEAEAAAEKAMRELIAKWRADKR
jgi:hypothetical protein